MLPSILSEGEQELLKEVRSLLAEALSTLAEAGSSEEEQRRLRESAAQLDELFLLVVVGEFNAGKSALINALLGESVLAEGVTPTTSRIHLVAHGDSPNREVLGSALERITDPAGLLRELTIVDTPGTNALEREHEALTADFVPRSDLVLFVTSADRPFSESERAFLEQVRAWGKKIAVVLNKVDILDGEGAVGEIEAYIERRSEQLLEITPPVFPVSARQALEARRAGDGEALEGSGLPAVERFLVETLDDAARLELKLLNPVGVADNLAAGLLAETERAFELLGDDLSTLDDIGSQLATYRDDVRHELTLRLADVDNVLQRMELRGHEFFDDTLRLARLPDLVRKERIRSDFERKVVADAPREIERKIEALIDWLVASDLEQWQAVVEHVNRRRSEHAERIVGQVEGRFEYDRSQLLETVGRAAREGMEHYDREREGARLAAAVEQAVAGTAIVEVGAVGLGATVALVASSTAADVTGLVAAGVLATLGLFIIPARRGRAKRELKERIAATRQQLIGVITDRFHDEAERSLERIRATIAPYSRFVRTERGRLEARRRSLAALREDLGRLRALITGG